MCLGLILYAYHVSNYSKEDRVVKITSCFTFLLTTVCEAQLENHGKVIVQMPVKVGDIVKPCKYNRWCIK